MRGPRRRSGPKSGWAVHLRGLFLALLAGLYHANPGRLPPVCPGLQSPPSACFCATKRKAPQTLWGLTGCLFPLPEPCPDNLNHQHCSDRSGQENTSRFPPPLTGSIFQTQTDLECFGKLSVPLPQYYCTWSPSQDPSVKTYTLLIRQSEQHPTLLFLFYSLSL